TSTEPRSASEGARAGLSTSHAPTSVHGLHHVTLPAGKRRLDGDRFRPNYQVIRPVIGMLSRFPTKEGDCCRNKPVHPIMIAYMGRCDEDQEPEEDGWREPFRPPRCQHVDGA